MVFSSCLFLFVFLPVTYILYRLVQCIRLKNFILILASLLFYSFGRLDWLLLLLFSVICNYFAGVFMTGNQLRRKIVLTIAVTVNLGLLCVFKYMNFLTDTLNTVLPFGFPVTGIALPIGISFFTFQGMSYVIDVYRNPEMSTKSFEKVLLYIAFFPQLVAGPIVKYGDISEQIDARCHTPEKTVAGIKRFLSGMVKKLFLANTLGYVADAVYNIDVSGLDIRLAWLGAICYTLQIYYDFSAYSDMAIGLGKIFGFGINENFDHPYISPSIKEFWRRWHISLSSWFRDYLYIPLGGNRQGAARARLNRLIVFFFTGMWHGANWTFIIWGLWHGFFLFLEDLLPKPKKKIPLIGNLYTLLVVTLGFVLFRAPDIHRAGIVIGEMFAGFDFTLQSTAALANLLTPQTVFFLVSGIVFSMPVTSFVKSKLSEKKIQIPYALEFVCIIIVLVLCIFKLSASSFNPFIYTQF